MKDLSRLGRDLRRVLILDNSPASYVFHPDNAVSASQARGGGAEPQERGQSIGPPWPPASSLVRVQAWCPSVPPSFLIDLCLLALHIVIWSILSVCRGPGSLLGVGAVVVFLGDSCDHQLVGHRNTLVGPSWDF